MEQKINFKDEEWRLFRLTSKKYIHYFLIDQESQYMIESFSIEKTIEDARLNHVESLFDVVGLRSPRILKVGNFHVNSEEKAFLQAFCYRKNTKLVIENNKALAKDFLSFIYELPEITTELFSNKPQYIRIEWNYKKKYNKPTTLN